MVHLHEPLVPGPTVTTLLLKPAPLVGTFHAAGSQPVYKLMAPAGRTGAASRLDVRVAVSDDARDLAEQHLGGEYEVLFNGIELDAVPQPPSRGRTDGPTVLFVGRHEERKGLAVLLEAVPSLPADARVWVAGDRAGRPRSCRPATPTTASSGWVGSTTTSGTAGWPAATVFCAPSLGGESFGVILLEAMAADTPVVASDIPGYAKVAGAPAPDGSVPDQPVAVLVPPGEPGPLATALTRVLTDGAEADRLRAAGRRRAQAFDLERLTDAYVEIYERMLGRSS